MDTLTIIQDQIKLFTTKIRQQLPSNETLQSIYSGLKLALCFNVDRHRHDVLNQKEFDLYFEEIQTDKNKNIIIQSIRQQLRLVDQPNHPPQLQNQNQNEHLNQQEHINPVFQQENEQIQVQQQVRNERAQVQEAQQLVQNQNFQINHQLKLIDPVIKMDNKFMQLQIINEVLQIQQEDNIYEIQLFQQKPKDLVQIDQKQFIFLLQRIKIYKKKLLKQKRLKNNYRRSNYQKKIKYDGSNKNFMAEKIKNLQLQNKLNNQSIKNQELKQNFEIILLKSQQQRESYQSKCVQIKQTFESQKQRLQNQINRLKQQIDRTQNLLKEYKHEKQRLLDFVVLKENNQQKYQASMASIINLEQKNNLEIIKMIKQYQKQSKSQITYLKQEKQSQNNKLIQNQQKNQTILRDFLMKNTQQDKKIITSLTQQIKEKELKISRCEKQMQNLKNEKSVRILNVKCQKCISKQEQKQNLSAKKYKCSESIDQPLQNSDLTEFSCSESAIPKNQFQDQSEFCQQLLFILQELEIQSFNRNYQFLKTLYDSFYVENQREQGQSVNLMQKLQPTNNLQQSNSHLGLTNQVKQKQFNFQSQPQNKKQASVLFAIQEKINILSKLGIKELTSILDQNQQDIQKISLFQKQNLICDSKQIDKQIKRKFPLDPNITTDNKQNFLVALFTSNNSILWFHPDNNSETQFLIFNFDGRDFKKEIFRHEQGSWDVQPQFLSQGKYQWTCSCKQVPKNRDHQNTQRKQWKGDSMVLIKLPQPKRELKMRGPNVRELSLENRR